MDTQIENKVIVITGGAEGVGYAIAEAFLQQHAKNVILIDVNESKGKDAIDNLNAKYGPDKAEFIQGDVKKDLKIATGKIFAKHKTIDCLVNNAGILDEYSPREVMEINTIAMMEWTFEFLEYMRKDKGGNGGTIFNLGSIYSYIVDPYLPVYKASKYAVMGFSRSLGHEQNYNMYGVRVLVLCPGLVHTKMTECFKCREEQSDAFNKFVTTMGWQTAADVGEAAVKVFRTADSGTAWSIVSGEIEQVP